MSGMRQLHAHADLHLKYGSASDEGLRAERERDLRLLLDATARPIDRAGDVRLDLGAMTTQADLNWPCLCARVLLLHKEKQDERTMARGASGAVRDLPSPPVARVQRVRLGTVYGVSVGR